MARVIERAVETTIRLDFDVDLELTLGPLWHGPGDAQLRFEV